MSNVPDGAQLSEDGRYWWDGENWQLVEGADSNENAGGNDNSNAGEVSADELAPVNDTGVEPGDESLIDERLKPYFEPDYDSVEDDYSYAEQGEVIGGDDNNNNDNSNDNQEGN